MPVSFTIEDIKTPERLERVLQQFKSALESPTALAQAIPPDLNKLAALLAPTIRDSLQATGSAPLNLQSLLPVQGGAVMLEDTHANRLTLYPPANYPVGTMFYETDRTVVYAIVSVAGVSVWRYISGVYTSSRANVPLDLLVNDTGFLFYVTDYAHLTRWDGFLYIIVDDKPGRFVESPIGMGIGYQLCDGTLTDYLDDGSPNLSVTGFLTPDEVSAPSGVYHKSAAAYSGAINAASGGGMIGSTDPTVVDPHAVVERLDVAGIGVWVFANQADADHAAHDHTAGTLAPDGTGEPRNLEVLHYFRR